MKRERFIEDLEEVGVCKSVYKRKYFLISEEKTVTRSDETGHVYSSWGERFDEAVSEDKTLGDLVDELEFVDRSAHYHLPMSVYDENGDRIKI